MLTVLYVGPTPLSNPLPVSHENCALPNTHALPLSYADQSLLFGQIKITVLSIKMTNISSNNILMKIRQQSTPIQIIVANLKVYTIFN